MKVADNYVLEAKTLKHIPRFLSSVSTSTTNLARCAASAGSPFICRGKRLMMKLNKSIFLFNEEKSYKGREITDSGTLNKGRQVND